MLPSWKFYQWVAPIHRNNYYVTVDFVGPFTGAVKGKIVSVTFTKMSKFSLVRFNSFSYNQDID